VKVLALGLVSGVSYFEAAAEFNDPAFPGLFYPVRDEVWVHVIADRQFGQDLICSKRFKCQLRLHLS